MGVRSIKFPQMFATNSTYVWKSSEYKQSTKQNLKLLLASERKELFGDPYFGMLFKSFMFNQNNYILRDQVIDMVYTQIALFMPQVKLERKDIAIWQDKEKGKLYCEFSALNKVDYTLDTYQLVLFDQSES